MYKCCPTLFAHCHAHSVRRATSVLFAARRNAHNSSCCRSLSQPPFRSNAMSPQASVAKDVSAGCSVPSAARTCTDQFCSSSTDDCVVNRASKALCRMVAESLGSSSYRSSSLTRDAGHASLLLLSSSSRLCTMSRSYSAACNISFLHRWLRVSHRLRGLFPRSAQRRCQQLRP